MYNYLFGPVPSRRLGISLGIDLAPRKTCNLNCLYCECGRTTCLTIERREYVPFEEVCEELAHYISRNPVPDYVTFSGSGEPLLYSRAGELIKWLKEWYFSIPVAVLTNGTLFTDRSVRRAVLEAEVVLPSLDATSPALFKKINRPHPALQIEVIIEGLISLRREYSGKIWLEVFIVPGMNDEEEALSALRQAIIRIAPDKVQLNTLDRPGVAAEIRAASGAELERIVASWQLPGVEIISRSTAAQERRGVREDRETAILETIARRPCTLEDLSLILGAQDNEVRKYLGILEQEEKIHSRRQGKTLFYETKGADSSQKSRVKDER